MYSAAFQPLAATSGVTLTTEVGGDALRARFDHDRLIQVLANPIRNAIKFTNPAAASKFE
jgi:signal transduction histidine kinase